MASYEALRHLTIGQYIPTGSLIHRLDPRAKLVALILLVVAVIIASAYTSSILLLLIVLSLAWLAHLPLRYMLSSVIPVLPVVAVLALMQLLFYSSAFDASGARILLAWGPLRVSTASVQAVVVTLLRFANLLCLASLLTNTTTASALTQGLEHLLRPLGAIGLPSHEITFVGAIALRFVPILGEQLESIMQAQASRRVGQDSQSRWHLISNARRLANLVVPLFVDAFHRAEELILAMQARCYRGGRGRTHLTELGLTPNDFLAMILAAFVVLVVKCIPLP
jgi:energy-coupling factor transport system permease protein